MRWSKLKQLAEGFLCEPLQGRVQYHWIIHRKSHDQTGTFRITFDGDEIFRASDIPYNLAATSRGQELTVERAIDPLKWDSDWRKMWESNELKQLHAAYDDAETEVRESGLYPAGEIIGLLFDYIHMPFDKALTHEHPFIRAIALFDRRLGKRRRKDINVTDEKEIVRSFYKLRDEIEG
ncbi:hypothetical protein QTL97_08280 [Sporosarcina thermotolerans]|uniref:DUF4304 domain-containing protein n=1 Tax=Sporosarcina thermotolerans TaxID=633404 RepID=A0AAW9ACU8_9BACL|nr:hypothetical protein [Sporosarcina thermotolerans]MDW0116928.1 hypothetical protein [Sporosarcina thermotolerans]WHT47954.1 hypothetical protein QNH10_18090 [Sporosarcina thermotolerans]